MSEELRQIADRADVIVNGYAFSMGEGCVSVLNLNRPDRAAVMRLNGEVLETSMDDIEIEIVREYLRRNQKYMEG